MSGLLVAGTTSDAGKSVVTTGLCRVFARRGVKVAPYKAQNMSNNSMVCAAADGTTAEIGRAQWVQALAARVAPEPAMNPMLLKPGSDRRSHVVLMGHPAGELSSADWETGRRHLATAAHTAYDDLAARFDVIVAEGAGSPAEINLRAGDNVNMGLARHASLHTVVVGDIDRGGVFAAMYGTVALLEPADQRLVAGFVVNKFRGELALLSPGPDSLERLTGRRVFGVLPWDPSLWLDSEDALDLDGRRSSGEAAFRIAVVRLPRISNFTDVDALGLEPDLDVVFVSDPRDVADADVIVVPGTRSTISDLAWLRARGLDAAILDHARRGRPVLGICGGFQMLGRTISDPAGVEGVAGAEVEGLGLLRRVGRAPRPGVGVERTLQRCGRVAEAGNGMETLWVSEHAVRGEPEQETDGSGAHERATRRAASDSSIAAPKTSPVTPPSRRTARATTTAPTANAVALASAPRHQASPDQAPASERTAAHVSHMSTTTARATVPV